MNREKIISKDNIPMRRKNFGESEGLLLVRGGYNYNGRPCSSLSRCIHSLCHVMSIEFPIP